MARILVVDDEAPVRDVVRRVLEIDGHEVVEFADAGAALLSPELGRADAVITDLMMPTPGAGFVYALRRRGLQMPVIVISGYLSSKDWDLVGESGASAFLEKPVAVDDLRATLHRLLG